MKRSKIRALPIDKFSHIFRDGLPLGSWILVSGTPGSGKTAFTQHIADSALANGYAVVAILTSQGMLQWVMQAKKLGYTLSNRILKLTDIVMYSRTRNQYLFDMRGEEPDIVVADPYSLLYVAKSLSNDKHEVGRFSKSTLFKTADLLLRIYADDLEKPSYRLRRNVLFIIDSITPFFFDHPYRAHRIVLDLVLMFRHRNMISVATAYMSTDMRTYGYYIEYVVDGLIYMWTDNGKRYLKVKKMRYLSHPVGVYEFFIEEGKGITAASAPNITS